MEPQGHLYLSCDGLILQFYTLRLHKVDTKPYFTFHSTNDRKKAGKHHYMKDTKLTHVNDNNKTMGDIPSFA